MAVPIVCDDDDETDKEEEKGQPPVDSNDLSVSRKEEGPADELCDDGGISPGTSSKQTEDRADVLMVDDWLIAIVEPSTTKLLGSEKQKW